MFSDTHFHFKMMAEEWGVDGLEVLATMAKRDCRFGLDIGTRADDLQGRMETCNRYINDIEDKELSARARDFLFYSAGIWPSLEEIHDRENRMKILRQSIEAAPKGKVVAIGEGGLDHHWNPSGVDGRCQSDFDQKTYQGERELFEMQLDLARELNLPFIIHSRDAFEDTLDCLKNVGYHNGIVHCYSYGIEEARAFLDLGWYIAFGGATTYTKKAKLEEMKELLNFVPADRLLLETDSPYLSPVPFRGKPNSPLQIEYVYKHIAQNRGMEVEVLSNLVDENIRSLFKVAI
ncbi:MAG: TatD family hydrolase [Treponema sp.]|nr:TatD family hydrolase [Treponema sp.]